MSKATGKPQDRTREVFEEWLARTGDYRKAAKRAGVSERTGRRWKAEPRGSEPSAHKVQGAKTNMLSEPTRFVGRQSALAAVHKLFAEGARIVTVLGPAGIGKTRLVLRYADLHASSYPGGVFFCDLSAATRSDAVLAAIAKALSAQLLTRGSEAAHTEQIGNALAVRARSLLVLDNLEQAVSVAAPIVSALVAAAPNASFLLTSRVQLRAQGEVAWHMEALAAPRGEVRSAKDALSAEAIELFVDRAQLVVPGYTLSDADAPLVSQIAQRLDGNALAIELAAARMAMLSPGQILSRLEKRFDLLVGGARDAPSRQASMRAALDGSWDLLTPHARAALAQASTFVNGFTLDAAEGVIELPAGAPSVLDALESLRQSSLLRVRGAPGESRFLLYETVREYAKEKLGEDPKARAAAERRHAEYFAAKAAEWSKAVDRAGGAVVRARAALDVENVLAAHASSLAAKNAARVYAIAAVAGPLLAGRGATERAMYSTTLTLTAGDGSDVRVLAARGNTLRLAGDLDAARADCAQALARAEERKDAGLASVALTALGHVAHDAGQAEEALAHFERSLALAEEARDDVLIGRTLGAIGVTERLLHRLDDAMGHSLRAFACHKKTGSTKLLATEALVLATLHQQRNEPERARARYEEALALVREVGDEGLEAAIVGNLGTLYAELGEVDLALVRVERAHEIFSRIGAKRLTGLAQGNLATLYFQLGRLEDAKVALERAVSLLTDAGDALHQGIFMAQLAGVLATKGAVFDAESLIEEAEHLLAERRRGSWEPSVSLQRAWIDLARAKRATSPEEAERLLASVRRRLDEVPKEVTDDVRVTVRMLKLALAAPIDSTREIDPHALAVNEDASIVRTPIGSRIELDRRRNVRLLLKALVDHHAAHPGKPLGVDELLAAGWPGEKVLREAGASRVYVALGTLRKLGLRDAIKSRDGGYLLEPKLKVVVLKDGAK